MNKKVFEAYYDSNRFPFLDVKSSENKLFVKSGHEILRKTACLLSKDMNVFIDSSDGINEDLDINEYCGRIKVVVKNFNKPFLYFKCMHSEKKTVNIEKIARKNGGKVLPFFIWNLKSQNPKFYEEILPFRKSLVKKNNAKDKLFDILYAADDKTYKYPKPNFLDNQVAWSDHDYFGLGSPKDMGFFELNTRKNIRNSFSNIEKLKIKTLDKMPYMKYIEETMSAKVQISPPGISEYTCRMFDSLAIGQCAILRKNSYDFYDSWKPYLPEIEFQSNSLEEDLAGIVENYKDWGEKALFYFEKSLSQDRLWEVFVKEVTEFRDQL